MIFKYSRELEAPSEYVFAKASDFAAMEKRVRAAGTEVLRLTSGEFKRGSRWQFAGSFRGKTREGIVILEDLTPPDRVAIVTTSGGLTVYGYVNIIALNKRSCRMDVDLDVHATTLRARLILQTLWLGKNRLIKRFRRSVNLAAMQIEEEFRTEF